MILASAYVISRHENGEDLVRIRALRRSIDPATSCGPTSLAAVCDYLGRPGRIVDFHSECGAGELGVCSMSDLVRVLKDRGLSALPVRMSPYLPQMHGLPMILHIDDDHFVAALPASQKKVVIVDPPMEPRLLPWASLLGRWRGDAVIVSLVKPDITQTPEASTNGSFREERP